jgi:formyl-CoA transferase
MPHRPLVGVHVLEAASYLSGPFAGLALADLGAEVLKLEPLTGDPYRRFGPEDERGSVMFRPVNRNKRSEAADLGTDAGLARFRELIDESDVLITNWRPGVAERFGLDPKSVRETWPRLIWARISGYGQTGPMAGMPAFDSIIQARTGTVSALVNHPQVLPMFLADKVTAMTTVQAVLAALVHRSSSGTGVVVDVAMLDSLAYFNAPDVSADLLASGRPDERVGRQMRAVRPLETLDGAIVISPVSGNQLKRSLLAAGLDDRIAEFKAIQDPTARSEHFFEVMADQVVTGTTESWLERFERADVPVTPVLRVEQHLRDPQVIHNQLYAEVEEPDGHLTRSVRHPALFDGLPVATDDLACPPVGRAK